MSDPVRTPQMTIPRVKGNVEPIAATLYAQNGSAVDLTGRTMTYRIVDTATNAVKGSGGVFVTSAAAGEVSLVPAAGDVDTAGLFAVYFIDDQGRRYPYDGARCLLHVKEEGDSD